MKKSQTVASRLPESMMRDLELVEEVEQTDRATAVRKLLARALEEWKIEHHARRYARGESTLGRAAEDAGVSQWRMMDYLRRSRIAVQYDLEDLEEDLATLGLSPKRTGTGEHRDE